MDKLPSLATVRRSKKAAATNLAKSLLAALKAYGAGEIFGIPGAFALLFFREIEQTNVLPLYTLSHEPAVGFAADTAARYLSTLGAGAVTYGAVEQRGQDERKNRTAAKEAPLRRERPRGASGSEE